MSILLKELAEHIGGDVAGDPGTEIHGAADIADARNGDIVFAESEKHLAEAVGSSAAAVITRSGLHDSTKPLVLVSNPRLAFAKALELLRPGKRYRPGIHPAASVADDTVISRLAHVGFCACIGSGCEIEDGVSILPFAYIGDNVRIGAGSTIHPFAAVHDGVTIGRGVAIHSGSVIGADGFGYTCVDKTHYKIPQVGEVVIGDDVEIGANVTVDRARTGKTIIGRGTKIDNLVHIAHNVTIGEDCIIIAQVGISGSVHVGDRVTLAGQAGVKDHVDIGSDAIICARSGVIGDIEPGAFVSGYPARPHKDQMRQHAAQARLPGLLRTLKDLEKRVRDLEARPEDG